MLKRNNYLDNSAIIIEARTQSKDFLIRFLKKLEIINYYIFY